MSKRLTVGNQVFEYPDNTQNPGWGEQAAEWAEAVTDVLQVFQGPNDLVSQSTNLPINGAIPGVIFSTASVASFKFEYSILNSVGGVLEVGEINGINTGTTFDLQQEQFGDDLGSFTMVFQNMHYTKNSGNGTIIKFSAKTIDKA